MISRKNLPVQCVCGHPKAYHDHVDKAALDNLGECTNLRCMCKTYIGLCPLCQHREPAHDGANGECTRVKVLTGEVCGCRHYA